MIASMKSRTGKTLDEWLALIGPQLPAERKGRLQWLKQRFDLKQNSAYLILSHLDEMDGTSLYAHGDALLNDLVPVTDVATSLPVAGTVVGLVGETVSTVNQGLYELGVQLGQVNSLDHLSQTYSYV